jgi:predicted nucleic acid-binding Zn ribbon protein
LDKELSDVAKDKSEPVENQVREYEELLASYKEVVEKLRKQEGASTAAAKSFEEDAEEDAEESSGRFEEVLKRAGVRFENDRVYIPLKKEDKVKRKQTAVSYSRETFDKVVKFVKFGSKVYANHLIRHVTLKLFELVKDVVDVSRYPGFADVYRLNSASFNGVWSRL